MKDLGEFPANHTGSLIVAHPKLRDLNFGRTVILINNHSNEEGALGVVINRPLGTTLGCYNKQFANSPLGKVPLYSGGPVDSGSLILTAWKWEDSGEFRGDFAITTDRAETLLEENQNMEVRGFIGYAGWKPGQIEEELGQDTWIVSPINRSLIETLKGIDLWKGILDSLCPEMEFLVDFIARAPIDPSMN